MLFPPLRPPEKPYQGGLHRISGDGTSTEIKRPINLKLGSQRVKLGYEIRLHDGTTILALGAPGLGFHGSIHPSGLIKVSDRFGFDKRLDLRSPELLHEAQYATEAFVEAILASAEAEPEIDEDVIALGNLNFVERRLFRRNRFGIDIDPFAALRPPGLDFPFVFVDQEAIPEYIQTNATGPTVLVGPESHRVVFTTPGFDVFSFEFNFENPTEFVRGFPFGDQIMDTFQASFEYLQDLPEKAGVEPLAYIQTQFDSLDQDKLMADMTVLIGGMKPPALRRFTTEGFQQM